MNVTSILDTSQSIRDYRSQVQPLIDEGRQVYLRVADLDDLHITFDYPRIKLADGQVVADTTQGQKPSGGADIRFELPKRELEATGQHRVAFKDHYTRSGKHVVDEWITLYVDKVMAFPVTKAIFLLSNFGRILDELDERTGRRLMLEQQVAEDAAAEALDNEPEPEVEEAPATPPKTEPAFLKGAKAKKKTEK
jgi:hypothetical protein